jgi:hypothetical protein
MPNSINISGFDQFQNKMKELQEKFPANLNFIAKDAADQWSLLAARQAPKDVGKLGVISSKQIENGKWEVDGNKEYSAYMEWGTKSRVNVPSEFQNYASTFMGGSSGGNVKELIYSWVLRKGLPASLQWPIFISIIKKGVRPHPYFFVQKPIIEQQLLRDLKQLISQL